MICYSNRRKPNFSLVLTHSSMSGPLVKLNLDQIFQNCRKALFGWIITGKYNSSINNNSSASYMLSQEDEINVNYECPWKIEEIDNGSTQKTQNVNIVHRESSVAGISRAFMETGRLNVKPALVDKDKGLDKRKVLVFEFELRIEELQRIADRSIDRRKSQVGCREEN
uniref:Uncharacterized protein n=1 Tax=Glossina brevipalpis TaxID=37001 RepID=A0A1A9W874_9MUSC